MEFDTTVPLDSTLVNDLPKEIRDMKVALGVVGDKVAAPASATSSGEPGNWAVTATYLYLYTGDGTTHTWVRTAVAAW